MYMVFANSCDSNTNKVYKFKTLKKAKSILANKSNYRFLKIVKVTTTKNKEVFETKFRMGYVENGYLRKM